MSRKVLSVTMPSQGRVADAMFQFRMLSQPFHVSTMLN